MPMVCATVAAVFWDIAMCSSCFQAPAHSLSGSGREHGRSIPFPDIIVPGGNAIFKQSPFQF